MTTDLRPWLGGASGAAPLPTRDLSANSAQLTTGDCFIALAGSSSHGGEFIGQAFARGASWALVDSQELSSWRARYPEHAERTIGVPSLQSRSVAIAEGFYQCPQKQLSLVGVTGTNGKSSICHFLAQAWQFHGEPSALIGTIGHGAPDSLNASALTTPDPIHLLRLMALYRDAGVKRLCLEVSSHALHQGRVRHLDFDYALFSNLSRDHLDYHPNMQAYADAKALLLRWSNLQARIINADDAQGRSWLQEPWCQDGKSISVSRQGLGDVNAQLVKQNQLELDFHGCKQQLSFNLVGDFNVDNALLCAACLEHSGLSPEQVAAAIAALRPVPGRMQQVWSRPTIIIDYAHSPDALQRALLSLRQHVGGKPLCLVFGCGGDRDTGKRALMGTVAAHHADRIIVTSDNPRSEDPQAIIDDIYTSPELRAHRNSQRQVERERAIASAIKAASADSAILIAGKGHENYQIIGAQRLDFDDSAIAQHYARRYHRQV